jgi:predicted TPR repeat methyltransferase
MKSASTSQSRAPRKKRGPDAPTATAAQRLAQAITLLRQERIEEAERALSDVLQPAPGQPDALHFLGVLRHTQGRTDEAVALIREALAAMPDNAGAWNNLGNVLLSAGRADEAVQAYEQGVASAPEHPGVADALNNLGTVYRKRARMVDAEAACRRALEMRPEFGDAWYNLSLALMAQGRVHEGLVANSRAIASWPRHLQARDQVIRALLLLGERDQAAHLYREWLAQEPDNPVVRHQLAACLGEQSPERASDAYVQQVFDAFAESFDAKLEKLHYRAPELVARALAHAVGPAAGSLDIVDAGCGTGLCGPLVRPWARRLAGCDLSVGMLRRARERRVYDALHQAELVYYLHTQPTAYDVVISADTLCYFGALDGALAAARRCLRPGGWLIFTVEALAEGDAPDHTLQSNGRYAHGRPYLHAAIAGAGLQVASVEDCVLRDEAARPVHGWLVSARVQGGA